jgi:5'(3')-deoxyribonucleotidase
MAAVARACRGAPGAGELPLKARQLFLDCDGVLADFDAGVRALLGADPQAYIDTHGAGRFWQKLATSRDFYARLPLMPDAHELFDAVRHLDPVILTGLPRGSWAAPQKVRWAAEHFPGTRILTVMAVDKRNHCKAGDVLVDDTVKHRHLWEEAGGVFIHHRNARDSLRQLAEYFPELAAGA